MVAKIKLKLRSAELVALTKFLAAALVSIPKEEVIQDPANYLVLSALHELYTKVKPNAEDIRIFSTRKDDQYSVSISRTQALAIVCVGYDDSQLAPELITYDANFIKGLIGRIYQEYLV